MHRFTLMASALAALAATSYLGTAGAVKAAGGYVETDMVTNNVDNDLVNPWGLTESTTSPFWVSDNGTGLSTVYTVLNATPTVATKSTTRRVSIPSPDDPSGGGAPTGAAWNPAQAAGEFKIKGYLFTGVGVTGNCSLTTAVASFLFVTEDGTIVGFNSNLYPTQALCSAATALTRNNTAIIAVDNSARGKGGARAWARARARASAWAPSTKDSRSPPTL
jgi:hypothetical protein